MLRAAKSWLEDPANDEKRRALIAQVTNVGTRLGGAPQVLAKTITRQLAWGRRRAPGEWEREVSRMRRHITETPSGPERAMLTDAYVEALGRGPRGALESLSGKDAREVADVYEREAEAVVREPLGPDERERALDALRSARGRIPHA